MKLFISSRTLATGTRVKVDGWLSGAGIPALLEACDRAARPLVIDLSDLRDADPDGVAALAHLRASGADLVGASPYIALLLTSKSA